MELTRSEYQFYLHSDEWKEKRSEMRDICDGLCMRCGDEGNILHHMTYDNILCEPLDELEWVCERCHDRIHRTESIDVPEYARNYKKNGDISFIT
jgi:hypothetical protein